MLKKQLNLKTVAKHVVAKVKQAFPDKPAAPVNKCPGVMTASVVNLQPAANPQQAAPGSLLFNPGSVLSPSTPPTPPSAPGIREINQSGIDLVKSFEGLSLKPYVDAAGHPTIGYGHLIKAGEHFDQITQKQAEGLLQADLASARSSVQNLVKVPLNDNQFAALVSFTFNLGAGALKSSDLLTFVNKGDFQSAANEFPKWNKARDQTTGKLVELKGLTRRRNAEKDLLLSH
jgi:lysozyme